MTPRNTPYRGVSAPRYTPYLGVSAPRCIHHRGALSPRCSSPWSHKFDSPVCSLQESGDPPVYSTQVIIDNPVYSLTESQKFVFTVYSLSGRHFRGVETPRYIHHRGVETPQCIHHSEVVLTVLSYFHGLPWILKEQSLK